MGHRSQVQVPGDNHVDLDQLLDDYHVALLKYDRARADFDNLEPNGFDDRAKFALDKLDLANGDLTTARNIYERAYRASFHGR